MEKAIQRTPLVSVCMITYNHASFIRQAIEGVLQQEVKFPLEIIIGEDCSTDGTRNICREYEGLHPDKIRLFQHSRNMGLTFNFFFTLREATGKYIALCEGDDYWIDSLKLQKQVDFLEDNPEYGMCYTRVKRFLQKEEQFEVEAFPDAGYCTTTELFRFNSIPTPTVVMKKEILLNYMKEVVPYCQCVFGDYPMWLYFSLRSKIKFMDEVTTVYRILEESGCHTKDIKKAMLRMNSVTEMKIFFNKTFKMGYSRSLLKLRLINNKIYCCRMAKDYRLLIQVLFHNI